MADPHRRNNEDGGNRRIDISELLNPAPSSANTDASSGHGPGRGSNGRGGRGRGNNGRGGGGRGGGSSSSAAASSSSAAYSHRVMKCSYCNRSFSSRDELTAHRLQSHPTWYICQICNSSFFDRGNLNKHVRYFHSRHSYTYF